MLTVTWVKSNAGTWLPLERVNLSTVIDQGVYVIWFSANPPNVVRIGQGSIADRLKVHRQDQKILAYRASGELLVTWASVQAQYRDGVERYLADQHQPLVGDAFPDVRPIAVNLAA